MTSKESHSGAQYARPSGSETQPGIEVLHHQLQPLEHDKKLGIALAGLGNYATQQLAPALQQCKFCRLAGIVTGNTSKIPMWQARYKIPDENVYSYDNFDEIASNSSIDIVYIVLPNALHAEFAIRAAKAGKHVICEKPMALTTAECDEMIAASKAANRLLGIGYRLHFEPYNMEVARIGTEKIFGNPTYIHAQHGQANMGGWRLDKKLSGGGAIQDLGIYCIQAARYACGEEPESVQVLEQRGFDASDPGSMERYIAWEMQMEGGLTARAEASYEADMNLLHLTAEHGWIELSPAFSYSGIHGKTATGFLQLASVNQQLLQMDDFALSVLHGSKASLPGELGKKDVAIIQAIYSSMQSGNRVAIE